MKKFLSIIAITAAVAVVLASCKNDRFAAVPVQPYDTTGFAEFQKFQAWKAMEQPTTVTKKVYRSNAGTERIVMSNESSNTGKVATRKKGWSKAAKYGVIGGGSGVVLGAVINKRNRVAGGVVGGIVGGGIGYLIGRAKDKKEGRY